MPSSLVIPKPAALIACLAATVLLASCAGNPAANMASSMIPTELYCDNYFVYKMCVRDLDHDGEADLMYFKDTNEIFMLSEDHRQQALATMPQHRCIQTMDTDMRQASSELLLLNQQSGELHKLQLKSRLMLQYSRFLPAINRCMSGNNIAKSHSGDDDSFGSEDFEEL